MIAAISCLLVLVPYHGAQANIAVAYYPMLQFMLPIALLLLIPIIMLEAMILRRVLKVTYKRALLVFGTANLITTVVGYPLVFVLLMMWQTVWGWVFAQFPLPEPVFLSAPWNPDQEVECAAVLYLVNTFTDLGATYSSQYCAFYSVIHLINFVVAFFGSFVIEYWVLRRFLAKEPKATLRMISFRANLLSYLFILISYIVISIVLYLIFFLFSWL